MKLLWTSAIASTVFFAGTMSANAIAVTLYDGNLAPFPDSQGELTSSTICAAPSNFGPCSGGSKFSMGSISQSSVIGGVKVDTNAANARYSGYANYNPTTIPSYVNPLNISANTLNQTTGYTLNFRVSLDSTVINVSDIVNAPRAVFSVIAISSDLMGIEIGFLPSSIFAQSASFLAPAQVSSTITTSVTTDYSLVIFNNTYALSSGATPIISGALQSYNFDPAVSIPPLAFNPYQTPSFIFFGDDTSEASGTFTLNSASLDTTAVPFEFSPTYGLLALGTGVAFKNWRKKQEKQLNK